MSINPAVAIGAVGATYGLSVGIIGGRAEAESPNGIIEGPARTPIMVASLGAIGAFGVGSIGAMAGRGGAVTGTLLLGGATAMVGIGIGSLIGSGIANS